MTDGERPRLYPVSVDELDEWRAKYGATLDEARRRFVQFVVLESFAANDISRSLAFKGGNALRFGYGYPRSTADLDFTANDIRDDVNSVREITNNALSGTLQEFGIKCRVTSVKRRPPGIEQHLPTYLVKVAYGFIGDRYFPEFETRPSWSSVLPVEISFNDVVCETVLVQFGSTDTTVGIKLCTLNDIVAEKLRAILQQVIRNRNRPQDVYDIARSVRVEADTLDVAKIGRYFRDKCAARGIAATLEMFDSSAKDRAEYGYHELERDLGEDFIPFDDAWGDVVSLAGRALEASGNA